MSDPGRKPPWTRGTPLVMVPGKNEEYVTQGMISPINSFVDDQGNLTGISFRFLWGLFQSIQGIKTALGAQFSVNQITNSPSMIAAVGATMTGTGLYFTPKSSRVLLTVDASIYNATAGGVGIGFFAWGSGAFPGTGSPYLGPPAQNITGQFMRTACPIASQPTPFTQSTVLGNLTPGTQYWADYGIAAGSGSVWITDVEFQIVGLIDPVT